MLTSIKHYLARLVSKPKAHEADTSNRRSKDNLADYSISGLLPLVLLSEITHGTEYSDGVVLDHIPGKLRATRVEDNAGRLIQLEVEFVDGRILSIPLSKISFGQNQVILIDRDYLKKYANLPEITINPEAENYVSVENIINLQDIKFDAQTLQSLDSVFIVLADGSNFAVLSDTKVGVFK